MKPDVTIESISMNSMGWLRETIKLPTPQSQTDTVMVPGRNTPIRFTEALGRVSYQPRTFEITLSMLGSRKKFNQMVSEMVNRFAGHLVSVVYSEDPDFYVVGTLEAEPSYDTTIHKGQLVLSCSDGDSYRYHTEETVVNLSGSGTVTLANDYMPVVPTVTTTAETALSWQIGTDTFRKSVSAGTWEFPELELQHGDNAITVTGNGSTTFQYREGRL
jgi:phage-related protein